MKNEKPKEEVKKSKKKSINLALKGVKHAGESIMGSLGKFGKTPKSQKEGEKNAR